jgi:hypothetical protein
MLTNINARRKSMLRQALFIMLLGFLLILSGCAFHSTAKDWNGLIGSDGRPAYYKTTTKVAFKLLIVVPFIGDTSIDGMVEDLTMEIAEAKGNHVRIVQGGNENYWYGFPPFTWILTPVLTTVAAEYVPDQTAYIEDQKKIRGDEKSDTGLNPVKW